MRRPQSSSTMPAAINHHRVIGVFGESSAQAVTISASSQWALVHNGLASRLRRPFVCKRCQNAHGGGSCANRSKSARAAIASFGDHLARCKQALAHVAPPRTPAFCRNRGQPEVSLRGTNAGLRRPPACRYPQGPRECFRRLAVAARLQQRARPSTRGHRAKVLRHIGIDWKRCAKSPNVAFTSGNRGECWRWPLNKVGRTEQHCAGQHVACAEVDVTGLSSQFGLQQITAALMHCNSYRPVTGKKIFRQRPS